MISIFVYVGRLENFFWAPANTFFFLKFSYKTTIAKMVKFQIHLWKKKHLCHQKGMVTLIFEVFLSFERLKTYFQTSAREISTILGLSFSHFEAAVTEKPLENEVSCNNVFYVIF